MVGSQVIENQNAPRTSVNQPQVDREHYRHEYNSKGRLASFWHQIEEVKLCGAQSVMEVGAGSGYTTTMLRREGIRVVAVDVDPTLKPDVLGSVLCLPFPDRAFEAALCCQVLEHLPWELLTSSIRELLRVTRKRLVISLPDRERQVRLLFDLPKFGLVIRMHDLPRHLNARLADVDPQHFWEIGCGDIDTQRVLDELKMAGAENVRHYRVFENPYHHFFVIDQNQVERGAVQMPISAPPLQPSGLVGCLSRCATWRRTRRSPSKPSERIV